MIPYDWFILYEGADYHMEYFVQVMKYLKKDTPIVMIRVMEEGMIGNKVVEDMVIANGVDRVIKVFENVRYDDRLQLYDNALCKIVSPLPFLYFKNYFIPITNYKPEELASLIKEEFHGLL